MAVWLDMVAEHSLAKIHQRLIVQQRMQCVGWPKMLWLRVWLIAAKVQVAYAIGKAQPVGLFIETFGTEKFDSSAISEAVKQVFDLRPAAIIRDLNLLRPIYGKTAAYGHFGRELPDFSWEKTDKASALKALVK